MGAGREPARIVFPGPGPASSKGVLLLQYRRPDRGAIDYYLTVTAMTTLPSAFFLSARVTDTAP